MAATEVIWSLLAASPVGAVVESFFLSGRDETFVRQGMRRARLDPSAVPEVWCDVPPSLARARFEDRWRRGDRHRIHVPDGDQDARWDAWGRQARPLALGAVLPCDTARPVSQRTVAALALSVRAAFA